MDRYQCVACSHIYDPAEGDPEKGIPPGTPFDSLPRGWTCPKCEASKDEFEPGE